MKIRQLTIRNAMSYREPTTFHFNDRINILIGPNGGGKSNLQRIIAVVLSNYFIHQYEFTRGDEKAEIRPIDLWNKRIIQTTFARFHGDAGDQEVRITLLPETSDLDNIEQIGSRLPEFNDHLSYWEQPFSEYAPLAFVDDIRASFEYTITNWDLTGLPEASPAWAFREYLRTFFIFLRLANRVPNIELTSPVFFFFSERTADRRMRVQTSQFSEQNYFSGFRNVYQAAMGQQTNLIQWGSGHFARLYWRAITKAGQTRDATAMDFLTKEPAVQSLGKYLHLLGYQWGFAIDEEAIEYMFYLVVDGEPRTAEEFSSGEREIVHFLLAMFALNVKDGLVIVDEPELHLHPRWQRIFCALFGEVAKERNNQFIIATHSPVFVAPDTVDDVVRIYRADRASRPVLLRDVDLPEKKRLVHMINSQNNERLFFADRVVLVEGITDRLVMASLVDGMASRLKNNEAVEIVDVGGKNSVGEYKNLLRGLQTPAFVVADRDYLKQVGEDAVKRLFTHDDAKGWRALADKKGLDSAALYRLLDAAVTSGDFDTLQSFWEYFQTRHERLREDLDNGEISVIKREVARLKDQNIFVLAHGEMEDYLPAGVRSVEEVILLVEDRNWVVRERMDSTRASELVRIAGSILGASEEALSEVEEELHAGKEIFAS